MRSNIDGQTHFLQWQTIEQAIDYTVSLIWMRDEKSDTAVALGREGGHGLGHGLAGCFEVEEIWKPNGFFIFLVAIQIPEGPK